MKIKATLENSAQAETSQPIRVCVVSPLYHPSLGGLGRQAQLLSERLSKKGAIAFVIARRMKGMPPANFLPSVKVYRAWSIKPYLHNFETLRPINLMVSLTFSISCGILLWKKRRDFDLVHFHGASLPLIWNLILLKVLGKKVVAKVAAAKLGIEAGSLKGRYLGIGSLLASLLRWTDAYVATTAEIEEGLKQDGVLPEQINRISNFIDSASFAPAAADEMDVLRARVGFDNHRIILYSGRFIERKGIDVLLQAWHTLRNDFHNARLVFLGDGPLLPEMKSLSKELALEDSVDFRGHVPTIKTLLQAADIFVLPSLQEGMPNALLEAMACGLPPVATRIGGVEDIVSDGENGLLVEPGDVDSLAGGLRRLLADESLTAAIAARAYQTIRDSYTLESTVPHYLALYRKLLTANPRIGERT
ncbi:MAG TPA: glycosyltransferase family 4 protein [Geothermobacteraceae bacterium]|nr:glycosyltransferase family 4 protein [Geothermobacteraceae bacterium]